MTVGPWKPISLHLYENRITDLYVRSEVSESLEVTLTADLSYSKTSGFISFVLKNAQGKEEASADKIPTSDSGNSKVSFDFGPGALQLWFPVGYGPQQPLYTAEVQITDLVRLITQFHPSLC